MEGSRLLLRRSRWYHGLPLDLLTHAAHGARALATALPNRHRGRAIASATTSLAPFLPLARIERHLARRAVVEVDEDGRMLERPRVRPR